MNPTPVYPSRQVHPPGPHPPLHHGSGPCGLTAYEWHVVLIFVILLMFIFLIAVVVAWVRLEDVSEMWMKANHYVQVARTAWRQELFKHVLPQHDIERHDGPITPGPSVRARAHPAVNFILAYLFPAMRHRSGSP